MTNPLAVLVKRWRAYKRITLGSPLRTHTEEKEAIVYGICADELSALVSEASVKDAEASGGQGDARNCDGCARGLPLNEHGHHAEANGRPFMACTADRYAPSPMWVSVKERQPEDGQPCWVWGPHLREACPMRYSAPDESFSDLSGQRWPWFRIPYWQPYFTPQPPKVTP